MKVKSTRTTTSDSSEIAQRAKLCPLIVKTVDLKDLTLLDSHVIRAYVLKEGYKKLQVSVAAADGRETPSPPPELLLNGATRPKRISSSASLQSMGSATTAQSFAPVGPVGPVGPVATAAMGESSASVCEDKALGAIVGLACMANGQR